MKTLYIVRHAKSSWAHPGLTDAERPIIDKGIKKTSLVTDFLKTKGLRVDLILSSHAVRAYETAKLFAPAFSYDPKEIIIEDRIYEHSTNTLLDILYELENNTDSVMLVGHNPTFTDFANYFLDKHVDWLPTSAVVSIKFHTNNWEELSIAKKSTLFVVYPGMLKKG